MVSEEKDINETGAGDAGRMTEIVSSYKVFWTVMPIDLPGGEGSPVRVGMSLALVGTDEEGTQASDERSQQIVSDKLEELAEWLVPTNYPNVEFEIRRHDTETFFLPGDLSTKRKNYVVGIRILHKEGFDQPVDKFQTQILKELESRLKDLGCPRDHWKKRPGVIA